MSVQTLGARHRSPYDHKPAPSSALTHIPGDDGWPRRAPHATASFVLSAFQNRSGMIWYQTIPRAHSGTERGWAGDVPASRAQEIATGSASPKSRRNIMWSFGWWMGVVLRRGRRCDRRGIRTGPLRSERPVRSKSSPGVSRATLHWSGQPDGGNRLAVFSEADRGALHVRLAGEAYPLGGSAPAESYLNAEKIIAAAKACGAEAIHPGYGFLAENGTFAERCEAEGFRFIGPPAAVIRSLGDKTTARRLMLQGAVPVIPGMTEPEEDLTALAGQAWLFDLAI